MKVLILRRVNIGNLSRVMSREEELPTVFPGMVYVDCYESILNPDEALVKDVFFFSDSKQLIAVLEPLNYDSDIVENIRYDGGVQGLQRQLDNCTRGWEVHPSNIVTRPYSWA